MSSLTTKVNPVVAAQNRDAYGVIEGLKGQLMAALPKQLGPTRYARILVTELRRNPKLMQCDPVTLLGSLMLSAQLGLEPGTGQVYLLPFKRQVQMIIGFQGLIKLAHQAGVTIHPPRIVREGDLFEVDYGNIDQPVVHKPALTDAPMTHVWCAATGEHMMPVVEVMSKAQIDSVMRSSQSKGKFGPWKDHYEEMARKTVVRRLAKYLPKSSEMHTAERVDGNVVTAEDFDDTSGEWEGEVQMIEGEGSNE